MLELVKTYVPLVISVLAFILSAWGFTFSRRTAKRIEHQEGTYKELHQTNVLKKAETVYLSLVAMESNSDPINLKNIYFSHGIDIKDWPYFSKIQRIKICEAWDTLNNYLSAYWLNENREIKSIRELSWEDIGKISLDRTKDDSRLNSTISSFAEVIDILRQ
jgi:hypothetical protein